MVGGYGRYDGLRTVRDWQELEGEMGRLARVAAGILAGEFAMRRHAQGDAICLV